MFLDNVCELRIYACESKIKGSGMRKKRHVLKPQQSARQVKMNSIQTIVSNTIIVDEQTFIYTAL